ncbi:MAG: helix-turn-helix transcriptional regulator [Janthinobacterium lividum]
MVHAQSIEMLNPLCQELLNQISKGFLYTSMMKIGEWVKKSREAAKLTQEQLGSAVGRGKATISGWEQGNYEPSYSQIIAIFDHTERRVPPPGLDASVAYGAQTEKDSAGPLESRDTPPLTHKDRGRLAGEVIHLLNAIVDDHAVDAEIFTHIAGLLRVSLRTNGAHDHAADNDSKKMSSKQI